jgi:hypothetical protein
MFTVMKKCGLSRYLIFIAVKQRSFNEVKFGWGQKKGASILCSVLMRKVEMGLVYLKAGS